MKSFAAKMNALLETRKQILEVKKRRNDGFTLLELLVVVAILAAIAGTATVALQDTDARAAAAAHVAMMDELNKATMTFYALSGTEKSFPDNYDSLLQADTGFATAGAGTALLSILDAGASANLAVVAIDADTRTLLDDRGITQMRVAYGDADGPIAGPTAAAALCGSPDGTATDLTDVDLHAIINSKANQTVAGLIYTNGNTGDDTGGCGASHVLAAGSNVAIWTGGSERILGTDAGTVTAPAAATLATITGSAADTPVYMAVGFGFNTTLFDTSNLGGMTSVPVYRHVAKDDYNRFIGLYEIGTVGTAAGSYAAGTNLKFIAVVDGAGDTKEEELGEWDGTRNT